MHLDDVARVLLCWVAMRPLAPCRCGSLLPAGARACPHCGVEARSGFPRAKAILAGAATTLAGGAFGITLMACYGCPPGECVYIPSDGGTDARVSADAQVGDPDAGKDGGVDAGKDAAPKDAATDAEAVDGAADDAGL